LRRADQRIRRGRPSRDAERDCHLAAICGSKCVEDRLAGATYERRVTQIEDADRGRHDSTEKGDPAGQHCRRSSDIVVDTDAFQRESIVASIHPTSTHRHSPIVELARQIAGLAIV
jgi:hypothetical protein